MGPKFEDWAAALAAVAAEGGGIVRVRLVDMRETPRLLEAARQPDAAPGEMRDLSAIADLLEAAGPTSRLQSPRCLVCRKPFRGKRLVAAVMLLRAGCQDPGAIFALGVCQACETAAGGHRQLWPTIEPILRAASPGIRDLSPQLSNAVGHA